MIVHVRGQSGKEKLWCLMYMLQYTRDSNSEPARARLDLLNLYQPLTHMCDGLSMNNLIGIYMGDLILGIIATLVHGFCSLVPRRWSGGAWERG